jgi:hypothetical protein
MSDVLATERIRRLALRPKEAARALGICERKLRDLLPELPHLRLGRSVILPVKALEGWLAVKAEMERSRAGQVADEIIEALHDTEK